MNEIWKDINGYQGVYQVSNLGRVRSLDRMVEVFVDDGKRTPFTYTQLKKGRILKLRKERCGYIKVDLSINSFDKSYLVHRLVALTFISNIHNKEQVNHKNGIKTDNRVDNLEWCTRLENMRHAYVNGLNHNGKGEAARNVKLTQKQVDEIRQKYIPKCKGLSEKLAQEYNVSKHTIKQIWQNIRWKLK